MSCRPTPERPAGERRVIVVGGGVAGIAAALDCADAGARVTLLEVRPRLGGAAYSFQRDGLRLDNGQHVFLRCCTAYRALLERLGSSSRVRLQPRLAIPVLSPGRRPAVLRRSSLPAPLHLAGALLRYRHLARRERVRAALAARALARLDPDEALRLERCEGQTLGGWLAAHGQTPAAIAALWDLIALPTLNVPAERASLALGAFVLQTGLLERADAGDVGFHLRPLSETIGDPAMGALARAGVDVRLGWRVERVVHGEDATREPAAPDGPAAPDVHAVRLCSPRLEAHGSGGALSADAVVVAVPHARAAGMLADVLGAPAARFAELGASPIVNVHVVYDRRVCELGFAAGVGTPVQYVFDRSEAAGLSEGQYLAVSISGAEREMRMGGEELRERHLQALAELFPRARQASVRLFAVSREHAATFAATPGAHALRPGPETPVRGLALAGAWTDTGWPATLEGAVRSGHAAAAVALDALGIDSRRTGSISNARMVLVA